MYIALLRVVMRQTIHSSKWPYMRESPRRVGFESLESRHLLAASPIISEFVASNDSTAEDGFGNDSDWIEIYNAGDEPVDLLGYHLTDKQDELTKWTFPETTMLEPGQFLLVFASSQDSKDPAGYWHTNFKLSSSGEYVALVSPTGSTLSQFGGASGGYPAQFTDVSYGFGGSQLIAGNSVAEYWIPTNGDLGDDWTLPEFDAEAAGFALGRAAVGLETSSSATSYASLIETELPLRTTNVYVRTEFELEQTLPDLALQLFYDDGVVVFLNGTQVFTDQDGPAAWNDTSDSDRRDQVVLQGLEVDLSQHVGLLREGKNVLAFHVLNRTATSSDMLLVPILTSSLLSKEPGYLTEATPGAANKTTIEPGPAIRNVTLVNDQPASNEPLIVTAEVLPTLTSVATDSVYLHYLVMYGNTSQVQMWDDGQGVDAQANDGIFTGQIPANIASAGEMVRWYVTADDDQARQSREPRFLDRLDSAEYLGTVIPDPTASTDLPVVHWFVRSTSAARTRAGTRASLFIEGEFYDNVQVDLHGQSTSSFVKTSFDFDANQGQKLRISEDFDRVSDFNLITNYGDQTKLRNSLGYGAHAASGGVSHFTFPVSVHRNGEFYGLYDIVEQGDSEFLERIGRDPDGALYKINNALNLTTNEVEQVSGPDDGREDLRELVNAAGMSSANGLVWDYDNLDIADMINYLAVQSLIMNRDFGHKNMYWYFDTNGTQLWSIFPWDVDLSFGHNWNSSDTYFDDTLFTSGGLRAGSNPLLQRMYADTRLESMYYRRLRTLMDEQLGERGTPILESFVAQQAIELEAQIADEALRDYEKWGIHPGFSHTPREAFEQLLNEYFERRRTYLERQARIPDPQELTPDVRVLTVEHAPESGLPEQQYIRFRNNESYAVDMSGWKVSGATTHTFKPGSVIPANNSLYLVADPSGFKSRTDGPRGGRSLLLQANTSGAINQLSGEISLTNDVGVLISTKLFGDPQILGDTNTDGKVDASDIDALRAALVNGLTDGRFDLDNNQIVNEIDYDVLVQDVLNVKPGDADMNGKVDFADFLILSANFGKSDKGWTAGNFDLDESVSFADFLLLSTAFGTP